mgnify:CR=1 FL=1
MQKVAVVLSGCGVFDGAEIHETCAALLALHRAGAEAVVCAPSGPQFHVMNHATGEPVAGENRDILRLFFAERELDLTRRRYDDLMRVMRRAADRMDPVLATFRDQVLFLKHNLNAQAVGSLDCQSRLPGSTHTGDRYQSLLRQAIGETIKLDHPPHEEHGERAGRRHDQ